MHFTLSSLLIVFTTMTTTALAQQTVSYEGFGNTVSCNGNAFGCTDGGARCCTMPTGFGFSAQFNNLPSGTQGQGYTNNVCTAFSFALFGPGTKCWNGGGSRVTTLNWFHSPQGTRRGISGRADKSVEDCVEPTYFRYEQEDGTFRTIKVPAVKGSAQKIADLHAAVDLAALAAYEDY